MLKKAGHAEESWETLQLNTGIYNVIAQHIEVVVDPAYCRLRYRHKLMHSELQMCPVGLLV